MKAIFFNNFDSAYIPHILQELYIEKVYERFFKGKKDLVVLDIGANIGLFSMFAYPYAKRICAVEPSKQHNDVMYEMIRFNHIDDKINILPVALSHMDGETTFYHNKNETMFSTKEIVDDKTSTPEVVPTMRLDTLLETCKLDHVDFMKLDVEGAEGEIIGSEGFAKVADRIDAMVIEYHDWSGRNPSQITTTLADLGFDVFSIPAKARLFGAIRKK